MKQKETYKENCTQKQRNPSQVNKIKIKPIEYEYPRLS